MNHINDETFMKLRTLVRELNESMYNHLDSLPGTTFTPFILSSNGDDVWIDFILNQIWNSDDDPDQSFDEIKKTIIEEAEDLIESLQSMKINSIG